MDAIESPEYYQNQVHKCVVSPNYTHSTGVRLVIQSAGRCLFLAHHMTGKWKAGEILMSEASLKSRFGGIEWLYIVTKLVSLN